MQHAASPTPSFKRHTLGLAVSTVLLAALQPAWAEGLVPVEGPTGMAIVDSQAHAPVIDIVAPNAQGLSHNQWQDYNVGTAGVVLNNSLAAGQAQVGGQTLAVGANAHFAGTAASTILNEVVGTRGSDISGEQVIFGQAADYVLSNPNGIVLNGARLTLDQPNTATYVVGTPELADGRIQRYDTRTAQQQLVVGQGGVDVGSGSVQLIAPSVQANGELTAGGDLSLLLGRQRVDARTLATEDITQAPTAVDANLLGAMQAERIKIINTQDGAGVNMGITHLRAKQGIEIASAGALAITSAATDDALHAQALVDAGSAELKLSAAGNLTLTSLALSAANIDARSQGRLKLDALSNETRTQRQATADDAWFTLAPGVTDAQIEERTLSHVGNTLVATGQVRLDGRDGIEMAATRIEGPESVEMYTVRGGLDAGAKLDKAWRTVRVGAPDAPEDSASTYLERAQATHIKGGSVRLPTGKLAGALIEVAHSMSMAGLGNTDISAVELKRSSTQGSETRRVALAHSRAHEAYQEEAYWQPTQIKARRGDVSIRGDDIRISGSKLSGNKVSVHSEGDLFIRGATARQQLTGARPSADQPLRSLDRTSEINTSSVLTARDTLSLRANRTTFRKGNITVDGSHLAAKQGLTINAQGNLWVGGLAQKEGFHLTGAQWGPVAGELQHSRWNSKGFRESQARSTIAGGWLQLTADELLDLAGAALDSKGDIRLQARDIQLTGSLEPTGPRNQTVWLDNDLPDYLFMAPDDNGRAEVTDRIHNGFSMKAGGDIELSAQRLATHAASVSAAGRLTLPGTLALFKDTPVQDGDAIRKHYHGYVAPRQSSWQALANLPLAALDAAVPANNGTTRESSFVAGEVGAETAQRIKDLNIPLTLR
jgi:hemolysin